MIIFNITVSFHPIWQAWCIFLRTELVRVVSKKDLYSRRCWHALSRKECWEKEWKIPWEEQNRDWLAAQYNYWSVNTSNCWQRYCMCLPLINQSYLHGCNWACHVCNGSINLLADARQHTARSAKGMWNLRAMWIFCSSQYDASGQIGPFFFSRFTQRFSSL